MSDHDPIDDTHSDHLAVSSSLTYTIGDDESPTEAVIRAVVKVTDEQILDLDPLYHVIDPEYLDGIFEEIADDAGNAEITFEFNSCKVIVTHEEVRVVALSRTP